MISSSSCTWTIWTATRQWERRKPPRRRAAARKGGARSNSGYDHIERFGHADLMEHNSRASPNRVARRDDPDGRKRRATQSTLVSTNSGKRLSASRCRRAWSFIPLPRPSQSRIGTGGETAMIRACVSTMSWSPDAVTACTGEDGLPPVKNQSNVKSLGL